MIKENFIIAIKQGKYPGYAVRRHQSGEFPYPAITLAAGFFDFFKFFKKPGPSMITQMSSIDLDWPT
jgi:hypothetical protein